MNNISSEPISLMKNENDSVNKQPDYRKQLLLIFIVLLIAALPIILFCVFFIHSITARDNYYHDFQSQLEKKYGASEDFSYIGEGNVYMGHEEKTYYSGRTKRTFTITKDSNRFSDNYWSRAYGMKVNNYLEEVLSGALSYKASYTSEGSLDGGSAIPETTEDIVKSSIMAINVVAAIDCNESGNHYCEDMRKKGVDASELGSKIQEVLQKEDIEGIRSVELEITNYSNSGECPEGTTLIGRRCIVNVYNR